MTASCAAVALAANQRQRRLVVSQRLGVSAPLPLENAEHVPNRRFARPFADRRRERQRRLERRDRVRRSVGAQRARQALARFQLAPASRRSRRWSARTHVPRLRGFARRRCVRGSGRRRSTSRLPTRGLPVARTTAPLPGGTATPPRTGPGRAARCRASAAIAPGHPRGGRAGSDRPRRDRSRARRRCGPAAAGCARST